jgi:hypothetical protein
LVGIVIVSVSDRMLTVRMLMIHSLSNPPHTVSSTQDSVSAVLLTARRVPPHQENLNNTRRIPTRPSLTTALDVGKTLPTSLTYGDTRRDTQVVVSTECLLK